MLDPGDIPQNSQVKLDRAYESLSSIAQDSFSETGSASRKKRRPTELPADSQSSASRKRAYAIAVAATFILILSSLTAYAAIKILFVGTNDASFFNGSHLAVYNSMKPGVAAYSVDINESITVEGTTITLKTLSCDRNVIILFMTVEINESPTFSSLPLALQESEWARLQFEMPRFIYSISSDTELIDEGTARNLDAYMKDGAIECMYRIVPKVSLPERIELGLRSASVETVPYSEWESFVFSLSLDLSNIKQPKELGSQEIVFNTTEGEKRLKLKRFTVSDLGAVMVVENPKLRAGLSDTQGLPEDFMHPHNLRISDENGNIFNFVSAGDGLGFNPFADYVFELSGFMEAKQSISFTPMLEYPDAYTVRRGQNMIFDITQTGRKLPTSEFGGYLLTGWDFTGNTLSVSLQPYGWLANGEYFELREGSGSVLSDAKGIRYLKHDYLNGDCVFILTYYDGVTEALLASHEYHYSASFGIFYEDSNASVTLDFIE